MAIVAKRYRVKSRLFGAPVLILQVEETGTATDSIGGFIDTYPYRRWRDATVEDLTVIGEAE